MVQIRILYNNIIYTAAGGHENARAYIVYTLLINYSTGADAHQAEKLEERFLFLNVAVRPRERISV